MCDSLLMNYLASSVLRPAIRKGYKIQFYTSSNMKSDQTVDKKTQETEELEVLRCSSKVDHEEMKPDQLTTDKTRMESELRKKQMMLQENQVL